MTKEELVILFFSIENEDRVKEAKEYVFKQLEILEILKKKTPDFTRLAMCDTVDMYNITECNPDYLLTKEEFELLKEWLNDIKATKDM